MPAGPDTLTLRPPEELAGPAILVVTVPVPEPLTDKVTGALHVTEVRYVNV